MTDEKDMDLSPDSEESSVESAVTDESQDQNNDASANDQESPPNSESDTPVEDAQGEGDELKVVNEDDAAEDDAEAAMLDMLNSLPEEDSGTSADDIDFGSASVANAQFQQLQQPAVTNDPRNIDLLMDVDLPVSIELGRTKMSISDILTLGPGSVVELNKLAGEPVDLLINYKVVARGEVVVVDESFGLRITQLMTPEERLKALADD